MDFLSWMIGPALILGFCGALIHLIAFVARKGWDDASKK